MLLPALLKFSLFKQVLGMVKTQNSFTNQIPFFDDLWLWCHFLWFTTFRVKVTVKISGSTPRLCQQSYQLIDAAVESMTLCGSPLTKPVPILPSFVSSTSSPWLVDMVLWLDSRSLAENITLHMALTEDTNFGSPFVYYASSDEVILVINSGASISITNQKSNFIIRFIQSKDVELKGIASGLNIASVGMAVYRFCNDSGDHFDITIPEVFYVPDCPV